MGFVGDVEVGMEAAGEGENLIVAGVGVALDDFEAISLEAIGKGQMEVKGIDGAGLGATGEFEGEAGVAIGFGLADRPGEVSREAMLFEGVRVPVVGIGVVGKVSADGEEDGNPAAYTLFGVGEAFGVEIEDFAIANSPVGDESAAFRDDFELGLGRLVGQDIGGIEFCCAVDRVHG